jgi:hypothetical protein
VLICGIATAKIVVDVSIERHHRRLRRDARSLAERHVGHVAVRRRPHRGLVEIPLGAVEVRLELVHLGFALLHVERAAGVGALELRVLARPQFGELELRLDRVDLSLIGRRVDAEQHVALLERLVRGHRHLDDFSGDRRHDLNRVASYDGAPRERPIPSE